MMLRIGKETEQKEDCQWRIQWHWHSKLGEEKEIEERENENENDRQREKSNEPWWWNVWRKYSLKQK